MSKIKKDKNLLDLPVLIHDRDMATDKDEISSTYLEELEKVSTPDELREFCKRWRNIWLLKWFDEAGPPNEVLPAEKAIIEDTFDAEKVLEALNKKDDNEWLIKAIASDDENINIMMQIAVPFPLLEASIQSRYWGVGPDLVMVRLFLDPYPELNEACRYGSGDIRK